jgi:transposase
MQLYAGIDLHSSNNYLGIIDQTDKRVYGKRLINCIDTVRMELEPFRKYIAGIAVESTYNWYWLVDGLQEHGYPMHLANPSAIQQYEGLKHTDDKWDSYWLAHMLRLGILPQGYIYPKSRRAVRDLMRRRLTYVQQRTSHVNSLQSMLTRHLAVKMGANEIKKLKPDDADKLFDDPFAALAAKNSILTIAHLNTKAKQIERKILSSAKMDSNFEVITSMPGVGNILGLTIFLEVNNFARFASPGNYASYCRCVKSERISNKKKKGRGNQKNGNKYLAWAYVEAAHLIIRFCPQANRFYQRKKAKANGALATKALANKLARATYCMVRDQVPFDVKKTFG